MIDKNLILEIIKYDMKVVLPDGSILSRDRSRKKYVLEIKDEIIDINIDGLGNHLKKFNYWNTKDGEVYEFNNMKTSHLENALKMLEKKVEGVKNKYPNMEKRIGIMESILRDRYITSLETDDQDIGLDL